VELFRSSKDYYWDGLILFEGRMIHPSDHLLSYLLVWIGVTTPLFILVFFLFSLVVFFRGRMGPASRFYGLLAAALGFNLLIYFILKPNIYNGLRHYLFLLPVLSTMAALGFVGLLEGPWAPRLKQAGVALAALGALLTLVPMARLYPYPYCYFNELTGGLAGAYGKFETDYWGAALREGALWLNAAEPSRPVRVKTCGSREQMTYYFGKNLTGDNDMRDPDYWALPANRVMLEREGVREQDLQARTVHVVGRVGVPLLYILRMK
jgi:hypothetical protein